MPAGAPGRRWPFLATGALLSAVSLQLFLAPNQLIDGGITGLALMAAQVTGLPLGAYIVVLNLPFLYLGWRRIGAPFAGATLGAVALLGALTVALPPRPLTGDLLLAAVFGGLTMGLGVGLCLRYGGSMDGTEVAGIILAHRVGFTVGEWLLLFNVFILGSAALLYGWEKAMYSLIAYFVAYKTIDVALEGLAATRSAMIISGEADNLARALIVRMGLGVTKLEGCGAYSGRRRGILLCVVTRLELARLKNIVREIDPGAFVAIAPVTEVSGGRLRRPG